MSLNHTGALLLAAAIAKVFPQEEICFSHADSHGFSVEFTYSETFQESFLQLLESSMRDLAKEEVQLMEMVASNARELFLHRGQKKRAESLQGVEGTVTVAKIGPFLDICTGDLEDCRHFSLLEFKQEKKRVSIFGVAFSEPQAQKQFLKKFRQYPKKCHEYFAKELDLYEDGMWHPRGMALKRALIDLWRLKLEMEGFFEIAAADPNLYFSKTGRKKFSCWNGMSDFNYAFDENSLISSLQFIQKWINIFGFESKWVLVPLKHTAKTLKKAMATCGFDYLTEEEGGDGSRVELRIADAIGRFWTGPTLWLKKEGIQFSLFGDLERFIALLLERYEGELPFWICPEQVRLLPFEGVDIEPVIKIFNRQNIRYFVDVEPNLLKEKMHRALRVKVPYVMVFGKREENSKQMNIRAYGSSLDETMTLEKMEQFLAERKLES